LCRVGLLCGEAGDTEDHFGFFLVGGQVDSAAVETENLLSIGEAEVVVEFRAGPDAAGFDAAVTLTGFRMLRGEKPPSGGLRCPGAGWVDYL
jgi:hypothetical protein